MRNERIESVKWRMRRNIDSRHMTNTPFHTHARTHARTHTHTHTHLQAHTHHTPVT